jgi:hypothetical protein
LTHIPPFGELIRQTTKFSGFVLKMMFVFEFATNITFSVPACLQPVSLCQQSSLKRDGLSNTSSKQVPRRAHQIKAYQVVCHESLCRTLCNPLTEKFTLSSSYS